MDIVYSNRYGLDGIELCQLEGSVSANFGRLEVTNRRAYAGTTQLKGRRAEIRREKQRGNMRAGQARVTGHDVSHVPNYRF